MLIEVIVLPLRVLAKKLKTHQLPRVAIASDLPKLIDKAKHINLNPEYNMSKDYVSSKQLILALTHQCPTRSTIAKATNIMQVEQKQITNLSLVTHTYHIDQIETPDQLKHSKLIN